MLEAMKFWFAKELIEIAIPIAIIAIVIVVWLIAALIRKWRK